MRRSLTLCRSLIAAAGCAAILAAPAAAQDSKSATAAKELAALLASKKLDTIAARDPIAGDTFIAALAFPTQLIVISAKYASPPLLNEKLAQGNHRDVYIELNSASVPESRVIITDLGVDGLRAKKLKRDDPADTRDQGGKSIFFDGNWREDRMSEAEYMKIFAESDDHYARVLGVLLEQAKK
jgi:hypothetical protein